MATIKEHITVCFLDMGSSSLSQFQVHKVISYWNSKGLRLLLGAGMARTIELYILSVLKGVRLLR